MLSREGSGPLPIVLWLLIAAAATFPSLHVAGRESAVPADEAVEPADAAPTIRIDYYFEPGCEACFRVSTQIVPVIEQRYGDIVALHEWDLGVEEYYVALVSELDRLDVDENAHVYMLVDRRIMLCGADAIEQRVFEVLDGLISAGLPRAPETESERPFGGEGDVVEKRIDTFTLAGVIVAGLIDGINPCAISTLVFLVSVLALYKVRGRHLVAVGGSFCLASFLTYTALGFGLLRALHLLSYFRVVRTAVDVVLVAVLLVLGALSLRDALRYRASHKQSDVTLRLPDGLQARIHRLIRTGMGKRTQVVSAFGLGCVVTGIESVCTGQVYVPTLVLLLKRGTDVGRALVYLLVYNLMFVAPLILVLVLTYRGLQLFDLIDWSRRNVVVSKLVLAAFFLALAVLVWAL